MVKKKRKPVEAGKGQPTVTSYCGAVGKPSGNKNEEKSLKNDKITLVLAGNNESNNSDSTSTTIQTEKGTIMGPNTASTDDDGKDLELDKTNNKNKEDVDNSGEEDEDEDGSPDKINSKFNDNQESYFNNGTEEATIMGADTEVTNLEVPSSEHNNVDGSDEKVGGKSKSNKEQTVEGTNKLKMNNTTETEEATSMEADMEAIGIEAQLGLLNHVVGFHAKGAVASKSMEEETNKVVNSKRMLKNTTNMENSEVKGGTINGDKEQTIGVKKHMKDEWEYDDLEEDDTMDDKQGKTEE